METMTLQTTRTLRFPAGHLIFQEGDEGDCVYIVESGEVRITAWTAQHEEVQIGLISAGEMFGEMALIDQSPRMASATAQTEVELMVVPRDYFESRIGAADPLIRLCMKLLMQRYKEMRDNFHSALEGYGSTNPRALHVAHYVEETGLEKKRLEAESDLVGGLTRHEFVLHYQPVVRLHDGAIVGCEALVRWQHPDRGLVPPSEFIPLAEDTGLITLLGDWIIEAACHDLARLNTRLERPLFVGINLSCRQIEPERLADKLASAMAASGLPPEQIRIEVTESLLMQDPERAQQALTQLKALGLQIALDDFGTGYSSFSYLHRFPIDCLKIDRSFVARVGSDSKSREIVRSLCGLAASLGLSVVAEGIESAHEAQVLSHFGADFGQGFHYARAVPVAELARLMVAQH
jgi:EAL domain-containing protein (putative c-di-GMP-specific phosphodiesterase class I)